jgi:hypothetical protein
MGFSLSLSNLGDGGCYWVSERQTHSQLLRACAEPRSERAFAELVRALWIQLGKIQTFLFGLRSGRVFTDD